MKKIICLLLTAALLLTAFPAFSSASSNGVQDRIDFLRTVYDTGTYFTASGYACYSTESSDCQLSNIPARGELPSGYEVYKALGYSESWSCRSFANYAFYVMFGEAYWNLKPASSPMLGDFIKMNGERHSAIYLWEDSNYIYVYDGNGDSKNGVNYNHAFSKSWWYISSIYHASNYDAVLNGGTPAFRTITDGQYLLLSSYKGLTVGMGSDGKAIISAMFTEDNAKLIVKKETYGTSLTLAGAPTKALTVQGSASGAGVVFADYTGAKEQQWTFESIAGGYVLRSAVSDKLVLESQSDQLFMASYSGSSRQMFALQHLNHKLIQTVITTSTCSEYGTLKISCTECDYVYYEDLPLAPHSFNTVTVAPTASTYGFTKNICRVCGESERTDIVNMTGSTGLVSVSGVKQFSDGLVYAVPGVTDEKMLDLFPQAQTNYTPVASSGTKLSTGWPFYMGTLTVIVPGDIDGDGKTDASDARTALRYAVQLDTPNRDWKKTAADTDFSGDVNAADARTILRLAVGIDSFYDIIKAR